MRGNKLHAPCCYQGGKQRIAGQIADRLLQECEEGIEQFHFFDLCCGSGAISVELINRGVKPAQITMLDASSWGSFWQTVGNGSFDLVYFEKCLENIPSEKREIKSYMTELSGKPISLEEEPYIYLLLQSCSFGGKQIWLHEGQWQNAFFRDYWEPTSTSIRRSPANPMQPSPETLYKRVKSITEECKGLTCLRADIMDIADAILPEKSIVYVDPPYDGTTSYGYSFDLQEFIERRMAADETPLFVSESHPIGNASVELTFGGAKGGISGNKPKKHREWLSLFCR